MSSRHDAVLRWRVASVKNPTSHSLAESLSCEGLPYEEIPKQMQAGVTAFRHLRHDERERRCLAFLDRES